ncbi:MAG TPA: hypothetical protein P5116_08565 [Eubacteriales bacterium]|nr:hypothetical protein [Clostridia bacterium]HRV73911.1 hypothetical protein [Eubacteriales bacterium]
MRKQNRSTVLMVSGILVAVVAVIAFVLMRPALTAIREAEKLIEQGEYSQAWRMLDAADEPLLTGRMYEKALAAIESATKSKIAAGELEGAKASALEMPEGERRTALIAEVNAAYCELAQAYMLDSDYVAACKTLLLVDDEAMSSELLTEAYAGVVSQVKALNASGEYDAARELVAACPSLPQAQTLAEDTQRNELTEQANALLNEGRYIDALSVIELISDEALTDELKGRALSGMEAEVYAYMQNGDYLLAATKLEEYSILPSHDELYTMLMYESFILSCLNEYNQAGGARFTSVLQAEFYISFEQSDYPILILQLSAEDGSVIYAYFSGSDMEYMGSCTDLTNPADYAQMVLIAYINAARETHTPCGAVFEPERINSIVQSGIAWSVNKTDFIGRAS